MSARVQYYNRTLEGTCSFNGEMCMNMDGCDCCDCYAMPMDEDDEDLL